MLLWICAQQENQQTDGTVNIRCQVYTASSMQKPNKKWKRIILLLLLSPYKVNCETEADLSIIKIRAPLFHQSHFLINQMEVGFNCFNLVQ